MGTINQNLNQGIVLTTCLQPCVDITVGYYTVNTPTLNVTNCSSSTIYILNGQNSNYIDLVEPSQTSNITLDLFTTGIMTYRFDPESTDCQLCLNINYSLNESGQVVFEEVTCDEPLPSSTISGTCSCGTYDCSGINLYQDTTWVINIPIVKKTGQDKVGIITPIAFIESYLGYPVTFEYYYYGTYGVDSPEITFTLDQTNYQFVGDVSDYNIYADGTGPDNVIMVVTAPYGAYWHGSISCVNNNNTLSYTYTFYKDQPGKVDLKVDKNPLVGAINSSGGISDGSDTYTSTFRNGSGSQINIDSSDYVDLGIFSKDTPFTNGGGFTNDYYVEDSSVKSIVPRKDSTLLAGGDFNKYNSSTIKGLSLLDSNGKLISNFDLNLTDNGIVNSICDINDNSIFVGGDFSISGQTRFTVQQCGYLGVSSSQSAGISSSPVEISQGTGAIYLSANVYDTPVRIIIEWEGVDIIDTGFIGNPSYNSQLNALGYPNATCCGQFSDFFVKNSSPYGYANITVIAPLPNYYVEWVLSCPTPIPTPSVTPSSTPLCEVLTLTTSATPPTEPIILESKSAPSYSNLGTIIHDPYNFDGSSPNNIYAALLTTPVIWKNNNFGITNGPLNRNAKWRDGSVLPYNTWVGFSKCIEVEETKTYYIGLGADNLFKFVVDGVTFVDITGGPYDFTACTGCNLAFQYWHIYPITLNAGSHIIEMYGLNYELLAAFGCEIYDNSFNELTSATSLSDLNIIFSTSGQTYFQLAQDISGNPISASGYTCPSGYTLCDGICSLTDCFPYPSQTPNATPTTTPTPSLTPQYPCLCYKFVNSNTILEDVTYIDCSNTTKLIRFKGTKKLCLKQIISTGPSITYTSSGYCVNGKCVIGQAPPQHIAKINKNGTFDATFLKNMGEGFDNPVNVIVPYINNTIIVGGNFTTYAGLPVRGIVRLNLDGTLNYDYKGGFNINGDTPNVTDIKVLSDGSILVFGGGPNSSNWITNYQGSNIPTNIVKIDSNGIRVNSFATGSGFNGGVNSSTIQVDNKIVVVGEFDCYDDDNDDYCGLDNIVRLNSDGTYDNTFVLESNFDDYVNKVIQTSEGEIITGGRYDSPTSKITKIRSGGQFGLYEFKTCDNVDSFVYLPSSFVNPLSNEYTLVYSGSIDDDNFVITLPLPFDVNFLGTNYTSVNMSSNAFLTFGNGGDPGNCCFSIPNDIPSSVGLPGVYLSVESMDAQLYTLYTGLTDGGNTMVVKYVGSYHTNQSLIPDLVFNYKFYRDESNYFDLIIESNATADNDDFTSGTNNGIDNSWIDSFQGESETSWRIINDGSITSIDYSSVSIYGAIKANVNNTPSVCGTVGAKVDMATGGLGIGGSMYFDGNNDTMVQINNDGGQFGFGGEWDFTIEWFQYYQGGSNSRPFSVGVYSDPNEMIGMSFEGSVYLWINNSATDTNILNDDLLNGWHHIAITRYYDGDDHIWRVFLDGVKTLEITDNTDTSNTYTLTLGNQLNNDGKFEGYITNFRVVNLEALYTEDFTPPTSPLTNVNNTILLMLSSNNAGLLTDTSGEQSIESTGVTWSNLTPFMSIIGLDIYYSDGLLTYGNCTDCGTLYQVRLLVRDGKSEPYIITKQMTLTKIQEVLSNGPIFSTGSIETYEILGYWLGGDTQKTGMPTQTPSNTPTHTPTKTPTQTQTPTVTRTVTKTNTPTTTQTPSVTKTQTKTPTVTKTNTPTKSVTPSVTKTPNTTQTPTSTLCCSTFDMSGGTISGGSVFQITNCYGNVSQITINPFTTYSAQHSGSTLCALSIVKLSGNGVIFNYGCGCVVPTQTPTPTVTKTKTPTPTVTKTPTKTKTPTPSQT